MNERTGTRPRWSQPLASRAGIRVVAGLLIVVTFVLFRCTLYTLQHDSRSFEYHCNYVTIDDGDSRWDQAYAWERIASGADESGLEKRGNAIGSFGLVAFVLSAIALVVPRSALFFATCMLGVAASLLFHAVMLGVTLHQLWLSAPSRAPSDDWAVTQALVLAAALCVLVCVASASTLWSIWRSRARPRNLEQLF